MRTVAGIFISVLMLILILTLNNVDARLTTNGKKNVFGSGLKLNISVGNVTYPESSTQHYVNNTNSTTQQNQTNNNTEENNNTNTQTNTNTDSNTNTNSESTTKSSGGGGGGSKSSSSKTTTASTNNSNGSTTNNQGSGNPDQEENVINLKPDNLKSNSSAEDSKSLTGITGQSVAVTKKGVNFLVWGVIIGIILIATIGLVILKNKKYLYNGMSHSFLFG